MLEGQVSGVRMTTINLVSNNGSQPVNTQTKPSQVNFRAASAVVEQNEVDTFIKEREKAKKDAKKQQNLNNGIQIAVLGALLASVGLSLWMFMGKGPTKTKFAQIADRMPSLNDDCINPKVRNFIQKTVKILNAPKDYIKYTGADAPRMVLFYGPTGTGKTFSAKLLAKEMGAEYAEIQFSDISSEYVGKAAVNITKKFKEVAKLAKKNPDKKYVITFNEIDSLINNVEKLGQNSEHLGQNRTSFLNGLDLIKDIPNLTVVGTTNINPYSAKLDPATLNRLGNIFEIEKPVTNEIKSAIKFQLGRSEAAKDLINNDAELAKIADLIKQKDGTQRDVENIVKNALSDFAIKNLDRADKNSVKLTADYLENAVKNKEVWAAGIGSEPRVPNNDDTQNKLMDAFWRYVAKANGSM